jgi:hypothetical protein
VALRSATGGKVQITLNDAVIAAIAAALALLVTGKLSKVPRCNLQDRVRVLPAMPSPGLRGIMCHRKGRGRRLTAPGGTWDRGENQ